MFCCQNTPLQTVTVQFVMYVQCAQRYPKTQCVAVRTHRYRPSQYSLLCTFSVHNVILKQCVAVRTHRYRPSQYSLLCTFSVHNVILKQCFAVRTHRYRPSQYILLCTFSVHIVTLKHNVLLSEHTVTVPHSKFVMYVQCAHHYCNTQCVAVRTHRYRPSQYSLLCTFSVQNITVTHNVLLSEHTVADRHSTICYVRFCVHNITVTHNVLLSEHTVTDRHSTICYVRSV